MSNFFTKQGFINTEETCPDQLYQLAQKRYLEESYSEANQYIKQALLLAAHNPSYYYLFSQILLANKADFKIALIPLLLAEHLDPHYPGVRETLYHLLTTLSKKKVVLSILPSARLGHFVIEGSLWMRRHALNSDPDKLNLFLIQSQIANHQILNMYGRQFNLIQSPFLWKIFRENLHFLEADFYEPLPGDAIRQAFLYQKISNWEPLYDQRFFQKDSPKLTFSSEEMAYGHQLLQKMHVSSEDNWFVTIFARDHAYLKKTRPENDWSYHTFRNADINTYHKAIEFILSKGGKVIRVGSFVETPLKYKHPKIIDYSQDIRPHLNEKEADFMDIFLLEKSKFMIGDLSGITDVANMLNVPTLIVNAAGPAPGHGSSWLYIPKKIKYNHTKQYVPYYEMYHELGKKPDSETMLFISSSHQLEERNLVIEDNTPEEILSAVKEMYARVNGVFKPSLEDITLLENYFNLFQNNHFLATARKPIALDYLKEHPTLFFKEY